MAAMAITDKRMKTIFLDIMLKGRYVCTLRYRYCPLFPIGEKELRDFVVSCRPSLRNQPFNIVFDL